MLTFMINEKSLPVFPQRGISFLFSKQIAVFEICEECKDIVTSLGGVDLVLVGHGGGQLAGIRSHRSLLTVLRITISLPVPTGTARYSSAISRRT